MALSPIGDCFKGGTIFFLFWLAFSINVSLKRFLKPFNRWPSLLEKRKENGIDISTDWKKAFFKKMNFFDQLEIPGAMIKLGEKAFSRFSKDGEYHWNRERRKLWECNS